jgi:hemerythrin
MRYTFDSTLETGHPLIDEQHKRFIQAVNDFYSACVMGKGSEEITKTMDFLEEYTSEHFEAEEQLQLQYNYPDYNRHKLSHESFKRIVKELRIKLEDQGHTQKLTLEVTGKIADWLLGPIPTQDKKIAEPIRNNS